MKNLISLILLYSLVGVSQAETLPVENRAVRVRVMGGFTGFDADAYRVVRSAMASLIVEGVVDQFVTREWGLEGGAEFCVELNPDPTFSVDRITNMLTSVHPGKNTIYEFNVILSCESLEN